MKKYIPVISLFLLTATPSTFGQDLVATKTYKTEVLHSTKVIIQIVETTEACVFTYDPRWAHEEDTSAARTLLDNYSETIRKLDELKAKGFIFKGYQDKENCSVKSSTFPLVLTADGERFFSQYARTTSLVRTAKEQNAFKKVRRVYLKGVNELKEDLIKKVSLEEKKILERVL